MPSEISKADLKKMSEDLPIHFEQKGSSSDILTDVCIKPFAGMKKIKYKSKYFLPWKRINEKKLLINKVNKLITDFNCLNDYLYTECRLSSEDADKALKDKGLLLHRNYLLQYIVETNFNILQLSKRLSFDRAKEFEKFLKKLEGMTSDDIIRSISKFKKERFSKYAQEVQKGVIESCNYMAEQIAKKYLKPKQESRRKQLLKKFTYWKNKLSGTGNKKEKKLLNVVTKLVKIFENKGENLEIRDIQILESCFGENRNWETKWNEKMDRRYNPFPRLDDITNRVVIMLYGIITDTGSNIDTMIKQYIH